MGSSQEQHRRVGHQGARQVEAAAHPAGVGLDRAAAGLDQIELLQQLGGAAARAGPAEVIQPADHVEVLEPGQVLVHRRELSGQPDPAAHVARGPHHVGAGHPGAAGIRGDQGGQNGDGGGLARPVGAEHAEHRALRHGEVETGQGGDLAVALDEPGGLNEIRHCVHGLRRKGAMLSTARRNGKQIRSIDQIFPVALPG